MEQTDNNMNTDRQLEQLRRQMAEFKQQLDRQEIVNDRLLRQSMATKFSWIKRYVWIQIALVPFLLLFFAGLHSVLGLSWWLFAYMAVMMVADAVADYRINKVDKAQLLTGNLIETGRKLLQMKQMRTRSFAIAVPGLLVWVVWLVMELQRASGRVHDDFWGGAAIGSVFGAVFGTAIGLVAAYIIFRRMQRTNDEILSSIRQLTGE